MKKLFPLVALVLMIAGCSKVPVTERRQLNLIREKKMIEMSTIAYADFLATNPPLPITNKDAQRVASIGKKISVRVEEFLKKEHQSKRVEGFEWEFNLVNDPTVNAWCMPGGKVVFYTGILPICKDDDGLAVVMGHEIAHAIARHGNERMSQGLAVQAGGVTISVLTAQKPQFAQELFLQSYGIASGLGVLSYSRKHESEADKMGLIFMAMAGYDPHAAVEFWQRMSEIGGEKPPELVSTHPSDERRIADLQEFMGEAMFYYNAYQNANGGQGQ